MPPFKRVKARPFNVSLPEDRTPVVNLARADYGSFSDFVLICVDAYGNVRLKERRRLTELELEEALLKGRRADAEHQIRAAEALRELDEQRLVQIQDELDRAKEELAAAKRANLTVEQLLDLAWHLGPSGERSELLRRLADVHGLDRAAVMRAAGDRHRADMERRRVQANLRILPKGGGS